MSCCANDVKKKKIHSNSFSFGDKVRKTFSNRTLRMLRVDVRLECVTKQQEQREKKFVHQQIDTTKPRSLARVPATAPPTLLNSSVRDRSIKRKFGLGGESCQRACENRVRKTNVARAHRADARSFTLHCSVKAPCDVTLACVVDLHKTKKTARRFVTSKRQQRDDQLARTWPLPHSFRQSFLATEDVAIHESLHDPLMVN